VTRLIVLAFYGVGFKDKKYYSRKLKPRKQIDFLGRSKLYLIISLGVLIAGFAFMGINGGRGEGALNFSVEFAGGSSTQVNFNEGFTLSEVEGDIVPKIENIINSSDVQFQMVADSYEIIFRTPLLDHYQREDMSNLLLDEFGVLEEQISTENISGIISAEMRNDAILALIIAVILMLIYIWIRFKDLRFSGSMIISILNDVLFVLVFYGVTRILVGNTFIAVMLTVFGYSSNSTIVIFDRIREGLQHKGKNADIKDIINSSISATLTRSIYTTISTVVTIAVLFVLGVSSIRAFSLPLIFGIGIGVYTSVCVAPAVLYFTKTKLASKDDD
jgi:SecD/SecF fusion protein